MNATGAGSTLLDDEAPDPKPSRYMHGVDRVAERQRERVDVGRWSAVGRRFGRVQPWPFEALVFEKSAT